jgi:type IV pilus assembly protein PilO
LLLCAAIAGGWYLVDTKDQLYQFEVAQQKEQELRQEFERKQKKAARLADYKQQLAKMRESLGEMIRQLPDKAEVAALLIDVSQTGLAAGLEFELFQPLGEAPKDFFAELPIKIRVRGTYHQFADFVSGLASLPRIVTIHDLNIAGRDPNATNPAGNGLRLEATVKTYRYLEEKEGGQAL